MVNCYNCGFKSAYKGGDIGGSFESWAGWLGIPDESIQRAKMEILAKQVSGEIAKSPSTAWSRPGAFEECLLPSSARPFSHWLNLDEPPDGFLKCLEYVASRGRAVLEGWDYHWAPTADNTQQRRIRIDERVIIPFKYQGKVVGWTSRYLGSPPSGITRYHNGPVPEGYLFNCDAIFARNRKFVLVLEGPFDAIAVDGVGVLGSTLNRAQVDWLKSTDTEKIIVPDRQAKNQDLIDAALEHGWSVSFPEWGEDIKDAADASSRYGRLWALHSIIKARTSNQLKIGVQRQMLKG